MRSDRATRERLLKAAARLFADRGFKRVTVREICRVARANVAAVNYHFSGKDGLYREVLRAVIERMRATNEAAVAAGEGQPAEERLRRYIHVSLCRASEPDSAWIQRLFQREITDPTPAFDTLVEQGVRPRIEALSAIVADVIDSEPDDPRVLRSVASIHAQWIVHRPNPLSSRFTPKRFRMTQVDLGDVAEHIAEFSIAGVRAIGRPRGRS